VGWLFGLALALLAAMYRSSAYDLLSTVAIESLPHNSFLTVRDPFEEAQACIDFSAIPKVIAPSSGLAANEGLPSRSR
jgi:hypothetical protein